MVAFNIFEGKQRIYRPIFFFFMLLGSILLIWRCPFGYANLDESFYLTFPYRFLQGDRIFYDEWFGTQMEALPLMPILALYLKIFGDMDGIFLFIRYLYVIVKIPFSFLIYLNFRKRSEFGAMLASLGILMYSGNGSLVLSYFTVSIGGMLIALLCLTSRHNGRQGYWIRFLGGLAFSLATIEIPHLALLFIAYGLVCIYKLAKKKVFSLEMCESMYSAQSFAGMLTGVAVSMGTFCIYVFSHITIDNLMQTITHIVLEDTVHPVRPWYKIIGGFFKRLLMRNDNNFITLACFLILGILLIVFFLQNQRGSQKDIYVILIIVFNIVILIQYVLIDGFVNYIIFAPNILAFCLLLINNDSLDRDLFTCFCVPGFLFMFLTFWASNQGFPAVANVSSVATVGSLVIIGRRIQANWGNCLRNKQLGFIFLYLVCFFSILTYYRVFFVFWENGIQEQTELITYGPDKGLYVSSEKYEYYNGIMQDTVEMRTISEQMHVLYFSDLTLWISGKGRYGTPTSLNSRCSDMLFAYYEEHPEKKPDVVYVEDGRLETDQIEHLRTRLGLTRIEEKSMGVILKK